MNQVTKGFVVSLCDYTGNIVKPWAESGYDCFCFDIRSETRREGSIRFVNSDVRRICFKYPGSPAIIFAFPPCTNLAVSGARWFRSKGLRGLIDALELVEACREMCEASGSPWMLENPVSTLATYWREPDYTFDPWEYAGYLCGGDDNYTKKTCLWTGGGFVMPEKKPLSHGPLFGDYETPDDRIHRMPPSDQRGNLRSVTPAGFAMAVFAANVNGVRERTE